jgi:hypothetical protein
MQHLKLSVQSERKKCKFVFIFRVKEKQIELQIIKQYIQEYSLKDAHKNNSRSMMIANFNFIQSIGIVSNPNNKNEINEIEKVIMLFQELDKQVFPLIYVDKLIKNDMSTSNNDWIKLGKEDCNWIGKPRKNQNLNRFINQEFDILIDLSYSKNFCLQYVFVQSQAKLKIMNTSDLNKQFADMMLEIPNPHNKIAFAKEIIHYLKVINKESQ